MRWSFGPSRAEQATCRGRGERRWNANKRGQTREPPARARRRAHDAVGRDVARRPEEPVANHNRWQLANTSISEVQARPLRFRGGRRRVLVEDPPVGDVSAEKKAFGRVRPGARAAGRRGCLDRGGRKEILIYESVRTRNVGRAPSFEFGAQWPMKRRYACPSPAEARKSGRPTHIATAPSGGACTLHASSPADDETSSPRDQGRALSSFGPVPTTSFRPAFGPPSRRRSGVEGGRVIPVRQGVCAGRFVSLARQDTCYVQWSPFLLPRALASTPMANVQGNHCMKVDRRWGGVPSKRGSLLSERVTTRFDEHSGSARP